MRLPDIYDQMILSLLILAALGIYQSGSARPALQLSLAVVTAALLDLSIKRIKLKRFVIPKSGIITGLLVGMILDLTSPWYAPIAVSAIGIVLKHIVVYNRRNVFNPAASGLVLGSILLGFGSAWWASSNFTLILVLGALVAYRVKGYYMALPYLFLFFLLFSASKGFTVSAGSLTNPLIYFFALFMLTEHKTAPHLGIQRSVYGAIVAVFSFVLLYYLPEHFLLGALLLGNASVALIEKVVEK